ncbi:GNAT family N-acetyltransferase [Chitinophagaceae bacterium MMS25-I14]
MYSFNFHTAHILENDRVQLRPLATGDFDHLLPFSLNEPEIWKYSSLQGAGAANMKQYIETALKARTEEKEYPFIVFDKQLGSYAGSTRFYDIQPASKTLQLGYTWYGKDFQGTGLNKQCKFLLLQFAFETMGMERVEFRADSTNDRSIAAMKSIGCTPEGILRSQGVRRDGTRRDTIVLSILKAEWEQTVKDMLGKKTGNI